MKVSDLPLGGLKLIEPKAFADQRGYFFESYHGQRYRQNGITADFVQDNISVSVRDTLRGLHYQHPRQQAKLVQVLSGEVFDVVVDLRKNSLTFKQVYSLILSQQNLRQLFIPEGFAHGFCVLSDSAIFWYKCSDFYAPDCEAGIRWDDPELGIDWPVKTPLLSPKDLSLPFLRDILFD